jgi:SET and MYND domain-containing protein 4
MEQAVGQISWNQDSGLELNQAMGLAKLSITSTSCKPSSSRQIAEHKHECEGVHWAAVLPSDIVLAGRIMSWYIEKRMLAGKGSAMSGPNLVNTLTFFRSFPSLVVLVLHCCSTSNNTPGANKLN